MTLENDAARDPLEAIASEFIERQRNGENPTVEEYTTRYPELAEEITELFPTISAVERLKIRKEHSTDGCASLGPVKLERLGDFRIIREIGRGGMGVVFEAEQESLARRVAVKVLPARSILDPEHLKRFEQEAQFAANLHHTNIVPVIGVGEESGFHYIVMQFIRGVGLDRVIKTLMQNRRAEGPSSAVEDPELDSVISRMFNGNGVRTDGPRAAIGADPAYFRAVARIGSQAAEALHYGHSQGTLHRDIKPANLLLDTRGVVWITDFGVAKAIQSEDVTRTTDVTGTLRYIAPERFRGQTDARSDTYSLGLTLYEMLTLTWAYNAADQHALTMQIMNRDLPAPRSIDPLIPRDLETIVQKATAREPDQRYATAGELAADLQRFLEGRPIEARRITSIERLRFWCRRNPVTAALTFVVVILLTLVAIVASIGYVKTRNANLRVTDALGGEKEQRQKAEATSSLALDVLDRIYTQFAPTRFDDSMNLTVQDADGNDIEVPVHPTLSKETAALLDSLLVFYDRLAEQGGDDAELRRKRASANHRVGTIQQYLGQFEKAEAAYLEALGIYEGLDPRSAEIETETARIHNELGRLYRTYSRPEDGLASHMKSLATLESLVAQSPDSKEARYELARTYHDLGSVTWRDFGPAQPREPPGQPRAGPRRGPPPRPRHHPGDRHERYLGKAIALLSDLIAETPSDPACRHLLGLCYRDRFPGMPLDQGIDLVDDAARILEDLVAEFPDVPAFRYDLAETYAVWDIRKLPGGFHARAEEDFGKALALLEALIAEHPHVPSYLMSRIHIFHKSADILRRSGRAELALEHLETALDYQRSLSHRFPDNSSYRVWTVVIQGSLARLLRDQDRMEDALGLLEDSTVLLHALLENEPGTDNLRGLLIETYMDWGDILHRMGDEDAARAVFDKAQDLRLRR